VLVERDHVLTALRELANDAAAGAGRLVLLGGEAGVGKTTLAAALTAETPEGIVVRRGACDSLATAEALGPLLDAAPEIAEALGGDVTVSRPRLFRRIQDVLGQSPTLLVLDDVHWADEATLDLLRFLGRRIDRWPLMIVAMFRADEVGPAHPLTVVMGDLVTVPGVVRMQVPPLTVDGVHRLVVHAGSLIDPAELHARTGGNPFYVTEVLAAASDEVPGTVRDAVMARNSRLSEPARGVLGAAAVLAQRIDVDLVVAVSEQPVRAVDECLANGVLVADGTTVGFRHELARLAVASALSQSEVMELNARALAELRRRGSTDYRRLTYHAAGCGDRVAVARYAPRAAERAARLWAHREAAEQYAVALRWLGDADPARADLLERRAYECYLTDQGELALELHAQALALYERTGDILGVGRSQRWLSRLSWFLGRSDDGRRFAASAVETLEPRGPGHELAMAYSNVAQLHMLAGDDDATLVWGDKALDLARQIGDREVEMHALNNVGTARITAGDIDAGNAQLQRSLDLALADDVHEHAARAFTNLGSAYVMIRQYGAADRYLKDGLAYCADRDLDTWRLYMSAWRARSLVEQDLPRQAQPYLDDVLGYPRVTQFTRMTALVVAGQITLRRGDDAEPLLDEALRLAVATGETQRLVPVAVARAEAAWTSGHAEAVVHEIDRAWAAELENPVAWEAGELCWWLALAGAPREPPVPLPGPFALMRAGEFRAAAQAWREVGCPLWEARALCASADLDDARAGLDLLARPDLAATRAAFLRDRHAQGLPIPRGPRPSSRSNAAGLTVRELEVLELLAEGLSNADLAKRLYLSEKTVGHHVSAVLRKLGEPTRARAVAKARRTGILTRI
jgi:DNA-binding CsgD family transcriptional regulator/tetratricopeptide (TPR) repeat protein